MPLLPNPAFKEATTKELAVFFDIYIRAVHLMQIYKKEGFFLSYNFPVSNIFDLRCILIGHSMFKLIYTLGLSD